MFEQDATDIETSKRVIRLEDVMHSLLDVALYLLQANRGCIMLLDSTSSKLQIKFATGYQASTKENLSFAQGEGIAGWVVQAGKPLVAPSVSQEPLFIKKDNPFADGLHVKTIICVPFHLRGEVIGVVNIDGNGSKRTFSTDDLKILTPIVTQMEKALEQAGEEGEEKLFGSGSKLEDLSQVVQELNMVYSKDELGPIFLESARAIFPQADSGFLMMEEDDTSSFQLVCSFGAVSSELTLPIGFHHKVNCLLNDSKKAVLISDRSHIIHNCDCTFTNFQARSMLVAPLMVEERMRGMMVIGSSFPNNFREFDLQLVQIMAGHISLLYRTGISYSDLKIYSKDMLDSVTVGVIGIDLAGKITLVNQAAEKIIGVNKEVILGKNYRSYANAFELEKLEQAKYRLLATGEPVENLKVIYQPKESNKKVLNLGMNLLRNSHQETLGITLVFEDITERLMLEEQLRRTERLVAAGQLAAGAAHEIKNPLTTIKGFCQILKVSLADDARVKHLDLMLSEAEQINNIINEMDRLAVSDIGNVDWLDLPMLVDQVLQEERQEGNLHKVAVKTIYEGGIPPILGNQLKIKQVFYHIINNSLQSMGEEGTLTIKVWVDGTGEVNILFSDTGTGIPEQDLELIFNPFYTSKPERVGLGLAFSYKTIREHGGTMEIDSILGEGTNVLFRLPINFQFADLVNFSQALEE